MGEFSGRIKRFSEKSHFSHTVGGKGATDWTSHAHVGVGSLGRCPCVRMWPRPSKPRPRPRHRARLRPRPIALGPPARARDVRHVRPRAPKTAPRLARPPAQWELNRARARAVRQVRPSAPSAPKRPRPRPRLARPHARTHARARARARWFVPCRSTTPAAQLARRPRPRGPSGHPMGPPSRPAGPVRTTPKHPLIYIRFMGFLWPGTRRRQFSEEVSPQFT